MNHTLVVGAAPLPGCEAFYRDLLAGAAHVVAADAAGEWCVALGRVPDAVIGDFDGSDPGAADRLRGMGVLVETHPAEKDATDLDLAVAFALAAWDCPLVLTAAFSARIDHTLAALGVLTRLDARACVREPGWSAHAVRARNSVVLDLSSGTTVGVVSLEPGTRVTVDGAAWKLDDAALPVLSGLGISNRALGGRFTVTATNGIVFVIVQDGR